MEQVPIRTVHLFPVIDKMLVELLKSLTAEEWTKPTIAKQWTVKDIAAHLLDTNVRTLSLSRDQHQLIPPGPINSYGELVGYLNELNAVWVNAHKRTSPQLLTEWLEITGKQFCSYLATLDPFANALFSVAWAGENVSKNWFHIAREYTEKFIHQLQIRDAVNKPGLLTKELFYPFIDTFMCGLPHCYRNVEAATGTSLQVTVTTEAGGDWFLTKSTTNWQLSKEKPDTIAAHCRIDPETAWKLFSKGIRPEEALQHVSLSGDEQLALPALHLVAVMA